MWGNCFQRLPRRMGAGTLDMFGFLSLSGCASLVFILRTPGSPWVVFVSSPCSCFEHSGGRLSS